MTKTEILNEIDTSLTNFNNAQALKGYDQMFYLEGITINETPDGFSYELNDSRDRESFLSNLKPVTQQELRLALKPLFEKLEKIESKQTWFLK